jgi:A/G-specific adenine glycosylase
MEECSARQGGDPERFPKRAPKVAKPHRHGAAFRLEHDRAIWLVRRPDKGLLGGMLGLPTTPWRDKPWPRAEALAHAPARARWEHAGVVRHTFTHFALTLEIWRASRQSEPVSEGVWAERDALAALPTVFRKGATL